MEADRKGISDRARDLLDQIVMNIRATRARHTIMDVFGATGGASSSSGPPQGTLYQESEALGRWLNCFYEGNLENLDDTLADGDTDIEEGQAGIDHECEAEEGGEEDLTIEEDDVVALEGAGQDEEDDISHEDDDEAQIEVAAHEDDDDMVQVEYDASEGGTYNVRTGSRGGMARVPGLRRGLHVRGQGLMPEVRGVRCLHVGGKLPVRQGQTTTRIDRIDRGEGQRRKRQKLPGRVTLRKVPERSLQRRRQERLLDVRPGRIEGNFRRSGKSTRGTFCWIWQMQSPTRPPWRMVSQQMEGQMCKPPLSGCLPQKDLE